MTPLIFLAAFAASFPAVNVRELCRDAQSAALPDKRPHVFDGCVREEETAKGLLAQKWSRFSAADRQTCTEGNGVNGMPFSYVEVLTCLQIRLGDSLFVGGLHEAARAARDAPSDATAGMPARLSPPVADGPAPHMPARLTAPSNQ